ncbi:uncharacterized protein YndB with AHSA1/START domain [Arthrobacter sp. CG_A4]|nr:uncharacterized protein YndB with AHSA1/START domain [Arthrobacter sp. CG_A4]
MWPTENLLNVGAHRYHLIEPPHRLVYCDSIQRKGQLMAIAVLTWVFEESGGGTRITVIDQVTSLAGQGMIDGHRNGHAKTLAQLVQWLTGAAGADARSLDEPTLHAGDEAR